MVKIRIAAAVRASERRITNERMNRTSEVTPVETEEVGNSCKLPKQARTAGGGGASESVSLSGDGGRGGVLAGAQLEQKGHTEQRREANSLPSGGY